MIKGCVKVVEVRKNGYLGHLIYKRKKKEGGLNPKNNKELKKMLEKKSEKKVHIT